MSSTNFSLTFQDSLFATVSDETVLNEKLIETDYDTQKSNCLVYHSMGQMNHTQFHNFFNADEYLTRGVYIMEISAKLNKDYIKEGDVRGSLGKIMLAKYNLDMGYTGLNKKENINWTVDLSNFNTAINNSSIVSEFVPTFDGASENNHLQIIFKFKCDGINYIVGFEWIMKN